MKLSKIISKLEKKGLHKSAENVRRVVRGALQTLSRFPNIFKFCEEIHERANIRYIPKKSDKISDKFTRAQLSKAEKFLKSLTVDELEVFTGGGEPKDLEKMSRSAPGGREAHAIGEDFYNYKFLERQITDYR